MAFVDGQPGIRIDVPITSLGGSSYKVYGTTTTKKKKKGRTISAQDNTDPYSLISAKITSGHNAEWDEALGRYKYT